MNESERPLHVLIIEDNSADVMALWYAFEEVQANYTSQLARNGVEAIQILEDVAAGRSARPDLIFLDLNLPMRTGHEVLALAKGDKRLQTIPVVVLSSSPSPSDVSSAYNAGASSYLRKPGDLDAMVDLVPIVQRYWFHIANLRPEASPDVQHD